MIILYNDLKKFFRENMYEILDGRAVIGYCTDLEDINKDLASKGLIASSELVDSVQFCQPEENTMYLTVTNTISRILETERTSYDYLIDEYSENEFVLTIKNPLNSPINDKETLQKLDDAISFIDQKYIKR